MNGQVYEIESYRQQSVEALKGSQSTLNCSGQYIGGQYIGGQLPSYWIAPCTCPSLGDYEISIQQISDGEPLLNYGPKLRLVMADPYKGVDLRDAIAKLKIALKECIK